MSCSALMSISEAECRGEGIYLRLVSSIGDRIVGDGLGDIQTIP